MRSIVLLPVLLGTPSFSQGTPTSLRPDVSVEHHLDVRSSASRMAYDPVQDQLWYLRTNGDVLAVVDDGITAPFDTVIYSADDHGINEAYGLAFHDSDLFVIGNQVVGDLTQGMIQRAHLGTDGLRDWSTVVTTDTYAWGGRAHGFNNAVVSPDGQFLYINVGSRTDHGEVQDVGGAFPGLREEDLTAKILRIPLDAMDLVLPNDEAALLANDHLFAWGLRNTYDMAFDAEGRLFGVENSGDHDDPEEMNWLREGHHYGFPWTAGGNLNPTVDPSYLPENDHLLNPGYPSTSTDFHYDPGFPAPPNIPFTEPVRNLGPHAAFARDPVSGMISDAADTGNGLTTFTCHRSPLGLVFDRLEVLDADLQGDAFLLSFTPGGDSTGFSSISPWGIPVVPVDPCEDLLHLSLTYDQTSDNYELTAERIVTGFYLPVDAELVGSTLYVLEHMGGFQRSIWRVNMPMATSVRDLDRGAVDVRIFPNPTSGVIGWRADQQVMSMDIRDIQGRPVMSTGPLPANGTLDVSTLSTGSYVARILIDGGWVTERFNMIR